MPGRLPHGRSLWQFRIRGKLILLHTIFSLALAISLLIALREPVRDVVYESELRECELTLQLLREVGPERVRLVGVKGIDIAVGSAEEIGLPEDLRQQARNAPDTKVRVKTDGGWPMVVRYDAERNLYMKAAVRSPEARGAVERLYLLLMLALLAVYGLIAATTEFIVLPKFVYGPIERLYRADEAVQKGLRDAELIPESKIPNDELGEIMRSRNGSILKLREQEEALNSALAQIESAAVELRRKNHLLETARRNLADQDRLASLGMMSAGIAHEINTPLAVLKGSLQQIKERRGEVPNDRLELMLRVTSRLEKLSESLLDFARARPPSRDTVHLRAVIDEAWTLVSLDRDAKRVSFSNTVDTGTTIRGDADRLTQVFVNLLRNAVDAMDGRGLLTAAASTTRRDGHAWISITISDDGPGIDPAILSRLFEPFVSTRLDSHGTGLGLAVADGIVREHGGVILARNAQPPHRGAVLEVMFPEISEDFPPIPGDKNNSRTAELTQENILRPRLDSPNAGDGA